MQLRRRFRSAPKPVEIEAQIEDVERKHRILFQANLLNGADSAVLMNESSAAPSSSTNLQQFCCGLATVFANTASVESNFSTLKWELDDRRSVLTSLVLEGIFQASY
ncbi:unnamed protein product [Phytophthora lilii]|uniref:Unnamed protein product n=1 Tax=Phytophthora lilii TaxID=2077276 RepID=A0A9W7CR16_9STRA|nr:unnamed protein product [Phytophthora lilii]